MSFPWPIPVTPLAPVACGSTLWRQGTRSGASIVVKATFGLIHEAMARLVAPSEIVREDRHRGNGGCLDEASELAPYLPGASVILSGAAHAPAGTMAPAIAVRLGLFRERPLVEKVLHVIGYRTREAPGSPRPFDSIPVVYERAFGGPGVEDNPVGTGAAAGSHLPNVVDPQSPHRPVGFGPVAKHWGPRRRLLGGADAVRGAIEAPVPEIPPGFDWAWFHAAPADQQVEFLRGDEWIVLDGLHPFLSHLQTRLPAVRAHARWSLMGPAGAGPSRAIELSADMLVITPETQLCSLIWRGHVMVEPAEAARMVVVAGIEMTGYPRAAALADVSDPEPPAPAPMAALEPPFQPLDPPTDQVPTERIKLPAAWPRKEEEEEPDPRNQTERIVVSKLKMPALPFAPIDPAGLAPAKGGAGAEAGGLPFKPAEGAAAGAPPGGGAPSAKPSLRDTRPTVFTPGMAALPFKIAPARVEDEASQTSMIDARELEAKALAPFALAEPGARPAADPAMIPGAPWSATPAASAARADPEEHTVVHLLPLAPLPSPSPPPLPAPSPLAQPSPPAAPPPEPGPDAAPPPGVDPTPVVAATPLPPEPASLPPVAAVEEEASIADEATTLPPPPLPPAEAAEEPAPETATGMRATVLARIKAREPLLDLDLAGVDLHDLDLTGAVLSRMNLKGARLAGCKLVNARLAGAQLGDADLAGADLSGADLGNADLEGAGLGKACFDGAILTDANLAGAQGPGASFVEAKATRASFARGLWDEASFARAEATGADFNGASLAGARFVGALLVEARFDEARGRGAVFDDARLGQARAVGAALQGASLRGADAPGSVWERATLDGASFAGASLKEANFGRASCTETGFAGADLGGANLQRLTGDGADLRDARMAGADLRQAKLQRASFERAVLRDVSAGKADLGQSRFDHADLAGATLRGARLSGASFAHAVLEGADLRDADLEGANVFGASRKTAKLGAGARGLVEVEPSADATPGKAGPDPS